MMVVLALLGGTALGVLAARQPATYRSEVHLLVDFVPRPDTPSPHTSRLMQRRVKTYASMMNTSRLTQPVIDSLGLPYTPRQLGAHIAATSPLNTLAIDVAVTDTVPARAADIANALAAEMAKVAERERPSNPLPAATRVIVDKAASVPERPAPVRWYLHAAAGTLAGFAIGLGIAVFRDTSPRRPRRSVRGERRLLGHHGPVEVTPAAATGGDSAA